MSHSSLRRWLALAAMTLVPVLPLTASCGADTLPVKGQLMLVITTNLAPTKDFDTLHVRISEEGSPTTLHDLDYALGGSQPIKLPATLGIVAGEDPNKQVHITVEARRGTASRITREAIATVPRDRIASLPLPIDGLCVDTPCPPGQNGKAQTCIAGTCQTAEVASDTLPDFDPREVFGGGDGACFDTLACFTNGKAVAVRASDCSIDRETTSGFGLNVAVVRPPQSDGICGSNACLLPLDRDPFTGPIPTGWREAADRAVLPRVICERALPVMITTACPTKNAPTCGPWSATGAAKNLGDASIPFDASGFPVGDSGLPSPFPQAVRFLDEDPRLGFVAGTATVVRATDESSVTGYKLYWADGPTRKLDLIATLPKTGADVTHAITGMIPGGATYLAAFSTNAAGELTPGVSAGPVDNYPRTTTITTNANDIEVPHLLVEPKSSSLLIVGIDNNATRIKPALLRCKLDGSGCTYADISAGEVPNGQPWHLGTAIDPIGQKLLVISDQGQMGSPKLYRCNLDGTSCTATPISTAINFSLGCRIPLLIDTVSQKLITILHNSGNQPSVVRCGLDGQGCTTQVIGPNSGMCPRAMFSPTDSKLLIFTRSTSSPFGPQLLRCELDGTNCGASDITGLSPLQADGISAAIDTDNQKIMAVTSKVNDDTFHFYRCNIDGTGCVTGNLGVKDAFYAPTFPVVLFDTVHHRMIVVGYTGNGSVNFFMRCNQDGTGCTSTRLSPPAGGSSDPSALIFGGKLITANKVFSAGSNSGVDVSILSTY